MFIHAQARLPGAAYLLYFTLLYFTLLTYLLQAKLPDVVGRLHASAPQLEAMCVAPSRVPIRSVAIPGFDTYFPP